MNFDLTAIGARVRAGYDKAAILLALAALLVSALWLMQRLYQESNELQARPWERFGEKTNEAALVDVAPLKQAVSDLRAPFQISAGRMMVAEIRVSCVNCSKPIPFAATVCPFCNTTQPEDMDINKDSDTDSDGMPDEWEKAHDLNPAAPEDAHTDPDGDWFTNIEEYRLGKTDPQSKSSTPPLVYKLRLLDVKRIPMDLVFTGIQTLSDGTKLYVVKNRRTGQDFYKSMGDVVDGWKLLACEEKRVEVMRQNLPVTEDQSVLTVERDGKQVRLPVGKDVEQIEYAGLLELQVDKSKYRARSGGQITMNDAEGKEVIYKVVDIRPDIVVASPADMPGIVFRIDRDRVVMKDVENTSTNANQTSKEK